MLKKVTLHNVLWYRDNFQFVLYFAIIFLCINTIINSENAYAEDLVIPTYVGSESAVHSVNELRLQYIETDARVIMTGWPNSLPSDMIEKRVSRIADISVSRLYTKIRLENIVESDYSTFLGILLMFLYGVILVIILLSPLCLFQAGRDYVSLLFSSEESLGGLGCLALFLGISLMGVIMLRFPDLADILYQTEHRDWSSEGDSVDLWLLNPTNEKYFASKFTDIGEVLKVELDAFSAVKVIVSKNDIIKLEYGPTKKSNINSVMLKTKVKKLFNALIFSVQPTEFRWDTKSYH